MNNKRKIATYALSCAAVLAIGGASYLWYQTPDTVSKDKTVQTSKTKSTTDSSETKKVENVDYKNINKDGSFYITKSGKLLTETEAKEKLKTSTLIRWYLDPYCSACVKLETLFSEKGKEELLKDDDVVIRYYPSGFLSDNTVDNYSIRASAFILGVAEVKPEYASAYFDKIMNTSFRPSGIAKSDEEFKKVFIEMGGTQSEWKKVLKLQDNLKSIVEKETEERKTDAELIKKSNIDSMFIPFILIGDENVLDFTQADDSVQFILDSTQKYKEKVAKEKENKSSSSSSSTESSSSETKASSSN